MLVLTPNVTFHQYLFSSFKAGSCDLPGKQTYTNHPICISHCSVRVKVAQDVDAKSGWRLERSFIYLIVYLGQQGRW
jgi:hypothetical protein